jgi:hypothetical protein
VEKHHKNPPIQLRKKSKAIFMLQFLKCAATISLIEHFLPAKLKEEEKSH